MVPSGLKSQYASIKDEVARPFTGFGLGHSNWQRYCVRLPEHVDQRALMQRMLDQGIATRRGIMCAHREAAYAEAHLRFAPPESERAQDDCILLPLYPQTEDEQTHVVRVPKDGCRREDPAGHA